MGAIVNCQLNNFGCIHLQGELDTVLESLQLALSFNVSSSRCKSIHVQLVVAKTSTRVVGRNLRCILLQGDICTIGKRAHYELSKTVSISSCKRIQPKLFEKRLLVIENSLVQAEQLSTYSFARRAGHCFGEAMTRALSLSLMTYRAPPSNANARRCRACMQLQDTIAAVLLITCVGYMALVVCFSCLPTRRTACMWCLCLHGQPALCCGVCVRLQAERLIRRYNNTTVAFL
jgi:hypothetical protein